jgi:uncharacterized ubiquitin-like protein YukD
MRRGLLAKINVVIVDVTGSKEQDALLPDDIAISKIIDKLVDVLHLPAVNTAGVPITYKFLHKVTGRHLLDNMTLAQCGVNEGDVLRLIPEITAGGG